MVADQLIRNSFIRYGGQGIQNWEEYYMIQEGRIVKIKPDIPKVTQAEHDQDDYDEDMENYDLYCKEYRHNTKYACGPVDGKAPASYWDYLDYILVYFCILFVSLMNAYWLRYQFH